MMVELLNITYNAVVLPLDRLDTPCLLLDAARMERNIVRLRRRLDSHGVMLRPHLKTAKSIEVAKRMMATPQGPATVSTLREAEWFAEHGVRDILYAVGIAPGKISRAAALTSRGIDLTLVVDCVDAARAVASLDGNVSIPVLIEIDCDGKRSGFGRTSMSCS
jgi:D-serine deaminase-like pyridoxal phosphate-dependent protein